ncbi:MAG: DNRLRE domain-containing protein [Verrucomicrobiales bacterium]|nr:DNRLRE domain-containing protein [Verrucomicrobiales bacterium]
MTIEEQIDLSLDNRLTATEQAALEAALLSDPESMTLYVQRRWLHAELLCDRSLLSTPEEDSPLRETKKAKGSLLALAAAATLSLFSLTSFFLKDLNENHPVATLIEAENCRWEGSDLPTAEGASLGTGTLSLAEGMATIQFESGATVTLEAPTVLEVASSMRCRLIEGSVVAEVPESAHGFTIDTEKMEVIDLGTRFGVTSSTVGGSHVFVFDGEVKVRQDDQEKAKHIFSGKSLHLGAPPVTADQEIVQRPHPENALSNWIPVSTAFGKGKDAYLRRTDRSGMTGKDPLLMVKHTELAPGNERRALLTFDLARIDRSGMQDAKLTLMMESSGLGFSSLVPDSTFTVYGALSRGTHQWNESKITWENSPHLTKPSPEKALFAPLAQFTITKGSARSLIEIGSDELSRFLLSNDDELVTLLLVRETGEFDKQGLVHAFASKEHPSGPAPTLWFQPAPRP